MFLTTYGFLAIEIIGLILPLSVGLAFLVLAKRKVTAFV